MIFSERCDASVLVPAVGTSFVYFLLNKGDVIYIGQTKKWLSRPFSHFDKIFDEVRIIECPEDKLTEREMAYITKYSPMHNTEMRHINTTPLKEVKAIVKQKIQNGEIPIRHLEAMVNRKINSVNICLVRKLCKFAEVRIHRLGGTEYIDKTGLVTLLERLV